MTKVERSDTGRADIQGQRAGLVTRLLAAAIDAGIVVTVLVVGYLTVAAARFIWSPRTFHFPAATIEFALIAGGVVEFCYLAAAWRLSGRTWGNEVLGLRVVNVRGRRLRWVGAIARSAFYVLFPIGIAWVAVSKQNRSVQDMVLRTSVIYDWPSRTRPVIREG